MSHPLQTVISEAYRRKAQAVSDYMNTLASAGDELTDEQVERLLVAIPLAGLSWQEVRDDLSAMDEKRKLEKIIADAEAKIDAQQVLVDGANESIAALNKESEGVDRPYLSNDYRSAGQQIADAQREHKALTAIIESAEQRLREIRKENPRAFGMMPEVLL